jgi:hypothetical protein
VVTALLAVGVATGSARDASAQQFNSDNYLTMPQGTATFLITHGERNSSLLSSFALAKNWEFFAGANLFWKNAVSDSVDHFSTTLYAKYMFVENAAKTGGFAVMGGVGGTPGYYERGELTNSFRTYWAAAPLTLPFVKGRVLWDLMPGFEVDLDRGPEGDVSWSSTYSTRVAVYGIIPSSAIVAEVYGSKGQGVAQAEYKAGVRWEPTPSFALAATYGSAIDDPGGAGFEVGFLLFTPRFLCRGGCR